MKKIGMFLASARRNGGSLVKDKKGATAIEYGLLAALISVAAIGGITAVGGKVSDTFGSVNGALVGKTAVTPVTE